MEPSAVDLASLPAYARERWPLAVARAERKAAAAVQDPNAQRLVQASQRASSASQRVVWLHRAASAWSSPLEATAACRKGCSHCCNIPVTITSIEADLIGRKTGRKPAAPAQPVRLQDFHDFEAAAQALQAANDRVEASACPFLQNGACAVYDVRPMACRLLINLDDDDLLCQLVPGQAIPVPYANTQQLKALFLQAQPGTGLADLREFFPNA